MLNNLVVDQIEFDGIVGLDVGVRVSNGSSIVGDQVRNTFLSELVRFDLEELERSFLGGDSVDGESTLDIIQQSEVFS